MTLKKRMTAPTPGFFKKIRKTGMLVAAVSGAIIAAPVILPSIIVTVAGYLAVAGAVATAVSQAATAQDVKEEKTGE